MKIKIVRVFALVAFIPVIFLGLGLLPCIFIGVTKATDLESINKGSTGDGLTSASPISATLEGTNVLTTFITPITLTLTQPISLNLKSSNVSASCTAPLTLTVQESGMFISCSSPIELSTALNTSASAFTSNLTPFLAIPLVFSLLVLGIVLLLLYRTRSEKRRVTLELHRIRAEFQELRLSKAADERLIKNLQEQLEELQWKLRRGER